MNSSEIDKANSLMISLCEQIAFQGKYDYRAIDEFIVFLNKNNLSYLANRQRLKLLFHLNRDFLFQQKQWVQSLDPVALDVCPASELYALTSKSAPRGTRDRWISSGGKMVHGKMMALKTDPAWAKFSRFGTPWPPFDYDNVMYVRDLMRSEIKGGLLEEDFTPMSPNDFDISLLSVDDPGLDAFLMKQKD